MAGFELCGQVVYNLEDMGSVICGLPPRHEGGHHPTYIDIRKTDKLSVLDCCRDCGQNHITNLISGHGCGCYLYRPPAKKEPSLFSRLYTRMKGTI
jgi:hypothetical protein